MSKNHKRERTHYVKQTVQENGKEKIVNVKVTDTVSFKCPSCNHHKAWKPRSVVATMYLLKCTRCGYMVPLNKGRRKK